MFPWTDVSTPRELELIVSFFDLTGFAKYFRTLSPQEGFAFVSDYYEFVGETVEKDGGRILKFMGDAGMVIFPEAQADSAVHHLKELKDAGDNWLQSKGSACRHIIKAHVGPVICGMVGTRSEKRLDVFGETVMTAAVMKSNGLAITPQLFRKLSPDTRSLLKKHTPPVTYIPVEERHRD